jgi:hypothetical protein
MPRWQRAYVAACAAVIGYCLMYAGATYGRLPKLTYYQIDHLWKWQKRPEGPVPSAFVGLWVWALVAGIVAGAAAWALGALRKRPIGERGLTLAMAWAATAFVVVGGYYTWNNWP